MAIVLSLSTQIQIALQLGYERVPDPDAYMGAYYIKDGLKWIFNIVGLKKTLNVGSDEDLKAQDYDVAAYYDVKKNWSKYCDMITGSDLTPLYDDLCVTGEPDELVYMADGMWLNSNGDLVER